MQWYEWIFDGIGTTIIGAICGFIGYKAAIKEFSKQKQIAGNDAYQKQDIIIDTDENNQSLIKQTQTAGNNARQVQNREIKNGK